jgi:hypothetical protein
VYVCVRTHVRTCTYLYVHMYVHICKYLVSPRFVRSAGYTGNYDTLRYRWNMLRCDIFFRFYSIQHYTTSKDTLYRTTLQHTSYRTTLHCKHRGQYNQIISNQIESGRRDRTAFRLDIFNHCSVGQSATRFVSPQFTG